VSRSKRRREARSARERDQLETIEDMRVAQAKLGEALVTAFTRSDGNALAAFGTLLGFVAKTQARARR
jgi:hypothetical protein